MNLFKKRDRTDWIVCHCSASPPSLDVGVKEIRVWHKKRGFTDIGYAYVIRRDGRIEEGRDKDAIGAHVEGWNKASIGICMVGGVREGFVEHKPGQPWNGDGSEDNFTPAQWTALAELLDKLTKLYPNAGFRGHRDFPDVKKSCPSFDFPKWVKEVYQAPKEATEDLTNEPVVYISGHLPTLWAISRQFKIAVKDILNANPGINPGKLKHGDPIRLPV